MTKERAEAVNALRDAFFAVMLDEMRRGTPLGREFTRVVGERIGDRTVASALTALTDPAGEERLRREGEK